MPQQTVKANLKRIEELEAQNTELKQVVDNQKGIAGALLKLTEVMTNAHTVRDMLTHRAKWVKIQNQLREVANAANTEAERDSDDQDNTG